MLPEWLSQWHKTLGGCRRMWQIAASAYQQIEDTHWREVEGVEWEEVGGRMG